MKRALPAILLFASTAWGFQVSVRTVTQKSGVKGKWDAQLKVPKLNGGGALAALAQADVTRSETAKYQAFVKEAKAFFKKPDFDSPEWSYEATSVLKLNSSKLLSFVIDSYQFEGGAHGVGVTRTYNFGYVGGKPKRLTLADCVDGPTAKASVQTLLIEKAMKTPGTDWIDEGMVTELTPEELNRFWISKQGLVFEFDPYELGSYASGPFTFTLTWKELKPLLKPRGPLAGVVR